MKICRWTFQRIICAVLLLLCCCGNVADDPVRPNTNYDAGGDQQHKSTENVISNSKKEKSSNKHKDIDSDDKNAKMVADKNRKENEIKFENVGLEKGETTGGSIEDEEMEKLHVKYNASTSKKEILFIDQSGEVNLSLRPKMSLQASLPSQETMEAIPIVAEENSSILMEASNTATVEEAVQESITSGDNHENITSQIKLESDNKTSEEKSTLESDISNEAVEKLLADGRIKESEKDNTVDTHSEDMPSFNEWAKKRLEEQEKNGHSVSGTSQTSKFSGKQKVRQKNYASTDCGAKVLSANPEAQGTSAVLGHYTDDYMLNPCVAKIWLVIELCESIQVERIEMANFELFSSSPKDFSVFSSDRYPTRDWKFLGNFIAKDERVLQNFTLDDNTFGKFFKLEVLSHYGSEHFCPLSRLRVFGTSEYDALDTEETTGDAAYEKIASSAEEDELVDGLNSSQDSPNLFGSAKNAVINIVKKAAQVLRSDQIEINADARGTNRTITEDVQTNESATVAPTCVCVERFRASDCDSVEEVKDETLQCEFSFLNYFLADIWSRLTNRRFHQVCSNKCADFNRNMSLNEKETRKNRSEIIENTLCGFFYAVFGANRFGAVCILDKILVDDKRGVSSEKSSCPYTNFSATPILSSSLEIIGRTNKKGTNVVEPLQYSSHNGIPSSKVLKTSSLGSNDNLFEKHEDVTLSEASTATFIFENQIFPTKTLSTKMAEEVAEQEKSNETKASDTVEVKPVVEISSKEEESTPRVVPFTSLQSPVSSFSSSIENIETVTSEIFSSSVSSVIFADDVQEGCSVFPFVSDGTDASFEFEHPSDKVEFLDNLELTSTNAPTSTESVTTASSKSKQDEETGFLPPPMSAAQKESVFVRLTNRIKALELNMSLSSQYLEELSRRYKKQMEEMQKWFNKTISAMNETAKLTNEQNLRQQEIIDDLKLRLKDVSIVVDSLLKQQENGNFSVILRHFFFMIIEIAVLVGLFLFCVKTQLLPSWTLKEAYHKRLVDLEKLGQLKCGDTSQASQNSTSDTKKKKNKLRSSSLESLSAIESRTQEFDVKSRSGETTTNLSWENRSSSSCSSLYTNKSWQEVENTRKRKKRNKLKNKDVGGLYRSQSSNQLDSKSISSKPPIVPPSHIKRPLGPIIKADATTGFNYQFDTSKKRRSSLAPVKVQPAIESENYFIHSYKFKWKNEENYLNQREPTQVFLSTNKFASLPHYEIDFGPTNLCKSKQTIIEKTPNFTIKKSFTEVCG